MKIAGSAGLRFFYLTIHLPPDGSLRLRMNKKSIVTLRHSIG
ncbi:hypothetical protein [Candidatus Enterococcus palustris]|nr:hypothetical protein [Enterococcus sp. 7F3_DIV0205]